MDREHQRRRAVVLPRCHPDGIGPCIEQKPGEPLRLPPRSPGAAVAAARPSWGAPPVTPTTSGTFCTSERTASASRRIMAMAASLKTTARGQLATAAAGQKPSPRSRRQACGSFAKPCWARGVATAHRPASPMPTIRSGFKSFLAAFAIPIGMGSRRGASQTCGTFLLKCTGVRGSRAERRPNCANAGRREIPFTRTVGRLIGRAEVSRELAGNQGVPSVATPPARGL